MKAVIVLLRSLWVAATIGYAQEASGNSGSSDAPGKASNATVEGATGPRPGDAEQERTCKTKKNVIFIIPDGLGLASETMARQIASQLGNPLLGDDGRFPLDRVKVGSVRTHSASHTITDSASAATAYACGIKTYNAGLAVDVEARPCATVLEAAKQAGYRTGLVVTSRLTHATPAAFSAHVADRDDEDAVALHQLGEYELGRQVDLMMGGGRRHFVPAEDGGVRKDGRNLLTEAPTFGWKNVTSTIGDWYQLGSSNLPFMSFFGDSHMSYELDRDPEEEPSLREMADKAVEILYEVSVNDCDSPGFFVMIEASRIDHAAHDNDISSHYGDVMAFHEMVGSMQEWVAEHGSENTLALSVSDHETGGLAIGISPSDVFDYPFSWDPSRVLQPVGSVIACQKALGMALKQDPSRDRMSTVESIASDVLKVTDPTESELTFIVEGINKDMDPALPYTVFVRRGFSRMVNVRAGTGWTTHGHSGVDVSLSAFGQRPPSLVGDLDNTEVGKIVQDYMGITPETINALTARLSASMNLVKPEGLEKRSCSHD